MAFLLKDVLNTNKNTNESDIVHVYYDACTTFVMFCAIQCFCCLPILALQFAHIVELGIINETQNERLMEPFIE